MPLAGLFQEAMVAPVLARAAMVAILAGAFRVKASTVAQTFLMLLAVAVAVLVLWAETVQAWFL
jgi:hypothetical protein